MEKLLADIRSCRVCESFLDHTPRPILSISPKSKILIIGQAPGAKVHDSGIPWKDVSGNILRKWLCISEEDFYNPEIIGILPMGFCYPGKGKSGDLPPRPECAPLWHHQVLNQLNNVSLILLIGQYAQNYYLGSKTGVNLTETVRNFESYLPQFLPMPHPSPRNRFWLGKNPWFEKKVIPRLQSEVAAVLNN